VGLEEAASRTRRSPARDTTAAAAIPTSIGTGPRNRISGKKAVLSSTSPPGCMAADTQQKGETGGVGTPPANRIKTPFSVLPNGRRRDHRQSPGPIAHQAPSMGLTWAGSRRRRPRFRQGQQQGPITIETMAGEVIRAGQRVLARPEALDSPAGHQGSAGCRSASPGKPKLEGSVQIALLAGPGYAMDPTAGQIHGGSK